MAEITPHATDGEPFAHPNSYPILYGVVHALVDMVCIAVVFSSLIIHHLDAGMTFFIVVAYDVLAFAGQAFFGYLADRLRFPRGVVLAGIVFTALAVVFVDVGPITAMLFAGVGNALFHVGAGALVLHVTPGRAAAPGIFVGPGALGLGLGLWMGRQGMVFNWLFLGALAVAFVYALFSENPVIPYEKNLPRLDVRFPYLIMGLLLFSIFIRSLVGFAGAYDCPRLAALPVAFAIAAFAGKSLGGIVADRVGWILSSVGALLISAPLIAYFSTTPWLLVIGLFFFQMTMPVTLVAIASILPGRPAFAFGLACLALIMGALPTFYDEVRAYYDHHAFFVIIVTSATVVFVALWLMRDKVQMRFRSGERA